MTGPRKPWLRLWDRTLDLAKAQRLSGDQFKGWINLMMLANRQDETGKLPALEDIAFALRISPEAATSLLLELVAAKLIDRKGSAFLMHDWQSWQPPEKTNAQRAHEWREEQKNRALTERSEHSEPERSDEQEGERSDYAIAHARLTCIGIGIEEQSKEEKNTTPSASKRSLPFVLPSWIPLEIWQEHRAVRKRKKGSMTPHADRLIVGELEKIRDAGDDPIAVLNASIVGGWTDVWPLKNKDKPANGKPAPDGPIALDPVALAKAQAIEKAKSEEMLRQYRERIAREKREKGASAP